MKILPFVCCACLFLSAGAGFITAEETKEKKTDPREKLETAIPEAIELLEKKKYAEMLKQFVPPEELKKITKDKKLEDFAAKFGSGHADKLLKALKQLQDVKPEFSDDKKVAEYKLKEAVGAKDTIKFVKIEKYWYIEN